MIKGELVGGDALSRRMAPKAARLQTGLSQVVLRLVMKLTRLVKNDKLSGQVLKVRTGRLRRSINFRMEGMDSTKPSGTVGTNVKYARPNEYGYDGTVRSHLRTIKVAFGRTLKNPVSFTMPAHKMTLPERSFLRSALQDLEPEIQRELRSAVTEAIK